MNISSPTTNSFTYATELITINLGLFTLVTGLIGNLLNMIIFISLKTFRKTSCTFYLISASFANTIHLIASLLSRILITGYNIDLTQTSLFACKLRQYVAVIAPLMSLSCMCFATVDQFAALTLRWCHFSQRHIAWCLVTVTFLFWCLVNIPVIIYHNIYLSPRTGTWTCSITNPTFDIYYSRFYISFLLGFIQLSIRISFGLMAFINVRSLTNRQTPIIRLERDKQITKMVLFEIVIDVLLSLPFFIYYTYKPVTSIRDAVDLVVYRFIIAITNTLNYGTFAVGFYIYCCASSRFRKQLIYVLVGIHLKYCCGFYTRERTNQVVPQLNKDKRTLSTINVNIPPQES